MRSNFKRYVKLCRSSIYLEPFFKIFSWELQHNNPTSFNELKKHFKTRNSPNRQRISEWTSKFRQTGSLKRKISRLAGRHQTARTPENLRALAETVAESPEKSVRLRLFASGLQIGVTSAWRILRKDLGLFPYTISMNHKLTARDCENAKGCQTSFCLGLPMTLFG